MRNNWTQWHSDVQNICAWWQIFGSAKATSLCWKLLTFRRVEAQKFNSGAPGAHAVSLASSHPPAAPVSLPVCRCGAQCTALTHRVWMNHIARALYNLSPRTGAQCTCDVHCKCAYRRTAQCKSNHQCTMTVNCTRSLHCKCTHCSIVHVQCTSSVQCACMHRFTRNVQCKMHISLLCLLTVNTVNGVAGLLCTWSVCGNWSHLCTVFIMCTLELHTLAQVLDGWITSRTRHMLWYCTAAYSSALCYWIPF